MKSRPEIKALAKQAFFEQRTTAILIMLILVLVSVFIGVLSALVDRNSNAFVSFIFSITLSLITTSLSINVLCEFIKIYNHKNASIEPLFTTLFVNFPRKVGGMLWMGLWFMLWSFLFVIPGIIKLFSYSLTPFILADCPDVKARDALTLSKRMTNGYKMEIFLFYLSWIGWLILSSLTFGILYVIYVGPYMQTSYVGLYTELRDKAINDGKVTKDELGIKTFT